MKNMLIGLIGFIILKLSALTPLALAEQPRRFKAVETRVEGTEGGRPYFFLAVAFLFREPNLWVLESDESEIKVFDASGNILYAFGRKGQGPGEFDMPINMDVLGERVFIADGANRRVQILNRKGAYLGGFRVDFFPRRIVALEEDRVVVAHLPSGRHGKEKMLHCYNHRGELLWEACESYFSGDSVFDALRNDIFLRKGGEGHFYVFGRSEERIILKFDSHGREVRRIRVRDDYPMRKVAIPSKDKEKKREISVFCWNGDWHEGKFYLAIPDYTDRKDVKPGKEVAIVDETGQVEAFIHFPVALNSLCVAQSGKKIFALDSEGELRVFEVKIR